MELEEQIGNGALMNRRKAMWNKIRKSAKSLAILSATVLVAACTERLNWIEGSDIRFGASTNGFSTNGAPTRAAYASADAYLDNGIYYKRIDWESGDKIQIYCPEASTSETGTSTTAHYLVDATTVSEDRRYSTATFNLSLSDNEKGLRWGSPTAEHHFYGVYPSPKMTSSSTVSFAGGTVTAKVPESQAYVLTDDGGTPKHYTAKPVLEQSMTMVAKSTYKQDSFDADNDVLLEFVPITTAVEFTLKSGYDGLVIKEISLISGSQNLSGKYTTTLTGSDWSSSTYPTVHVASGDAEKTASVSFSSTGVALNKDETLTFTIFLLPEDDLNDLKFRIYKGGDADGLFVETSLKNTSDTTLFPRCKKSSVTGILVPEGVYWNYDGTVTPWTNSDEYAQLQRVGSMTVTGRVQTDYQANGDKSYSVTSDLDWKLQYTTNGGSSWTDAVANQTIDGWISFDVVSGSGSSSPNTVTATVVAASSETDYTLGYTAILRATPEMGTESEPYDLSMYDIYGDPRTAGKPVTANCYVVSAPGWYAFPLVYGNAIDYDKISTDGDNTEAYNPTGTSAARFLKPFRSGTGDITSPFITGATTAYPLWEDVPAYGLISNTSDKCKLIAQNSSTAQNLALGTRCGYVEFYIEPTTISEGNAVIAISDGTDILWSWHIWVTAADLTCKTVANAASNPTFNKGMLPVNLGWVDLGTEMHGYEGKTLQIRFVQESDSNPVNKIAIRKEHGISTTTPNGQSPTYQWGRKDPFIRADNLTTTAQNLTDDQYSGTNIIPNSSDYITLQYSIKNPTSFGSSDMWCNPYNKDVGGKYANLWSANNAVFDDDAYHDVPVKTVYDPCPPGFQVPQGDAFDGFQHKDTGTNPNISGSFTRGWYFYTNPATKDETIFFPAAGFRDTNSPLGKIIEVSRFGDYWTVVPSNLVNGRNAYRFFLREQVQQPDLYQAYIKNDLCSASGFSIRPVRE